jgi:dTDP-4-amino-4,6-dideoxygalactose transaminase
MIKFLDLYGQYQKIAGEMDAAIQRVIKNSSYIGGEDVKAFEAEFGAYQSAKHCIAVGNGTDAIEIILEAMAFPPGSEVIVPANSFIASSEAVTREGYRVIFADADPATYTLDVADVERRITAKTRAIIAVHLYGQPADMSGLLALCEKHGLKLIEDCAQAHGAEFDGRRVGAIGHAGTFSFYPGKNLGAYGDAGAITTQDDALALKCRMIANHGRTGKYDHSFEGRNSRLDGLQAAILRVKLPHLDTWLATRRRIAAIYSEGLQGVGDLTLPTTVAKRLHSFHLFVIRTAERERLASFLNQRGIQTGVHYPIALPKLAAYDYLGQGAEPMFANRTDRELLSLPMGDHLSDDEAHSVVAAVKAFFA